MSSVTAKTMPIIFSHLNIATLMSRLLLCLCPGILVSLWFFGIGVLLNIIISVLAGLLFEAAALKLRGKNLKSNLSDYSAIVTALLFALSIPLGAPWWVILMGMAFAIIIGKHAFGGLGQNSFNPAMSGYLFLLLSYPVLMTSWHVPLIHSLSGETISPLSLNGIVQSLSATFAMPALITAQAADLFDGMAMATPLIEYKLASPNAISKALTNQTGVFNRSSATGWELINMANLLGGLVLLKLGVIRWHIPFSILATLAALSIGLYSSGSAAVVGSPYLHLFGGATMLGAFFIATDPVSAATTNGGRIAYGIIIGLAIYSIRVWGSYLDAVAIAVIFANFWAPLCDIMFKPTVYGHPGFFDRIKQDLGEWLK
ncbi:MAG: electron transport complex protein RnfD [Pseudohongiellaceae bacterium]|jgi:electron transport complex protein RnfD